MTETQSGQGATEGTVCWRSPSNIAIVKYWGKHGEQLPANPSISLTLKNAYTETRVTSAEASQSGPAVDFFFHGERHDAFGARLQAFIKRLTQDYPVLGEMSLRIHSENAFPHSAGIASSASAMSALALCLCTITGEDESTFMRNVSRIARLGSGSACRSVYAPVALWGMTPSVAGSSDEYAIPIEADPVFETMRDTILIVNAEPKAVSSSRGHALMEGHVFSEARAKQALGNLEKLLVAMKTGDVTAFGQIAEAEALSLHALMMTSEPSYILMKSNTLTILEAIRDYREASGIPVYFTLDAGPNVHVLYPEHYETQVGDWLSRDVLQYCTGQKIIYDQVGAGPERIA